MRVAACAVLLLPAGGLAQTKLKLTLDDVIKIARQRSFNAKSARLKYVSGYWTYRSFRAELLPAVNLSGQLLNFDHSTVEARNSETGRISYVDNNSLANSLTLSVDQQLPSLGGVVSLQSYLYRLDQFDYNQTTYNSQPLRLTYTQPLRTYNALKWQKKTAPVEFEIAKKTYLEDMEDVTISVTNLFFGAIKAQSDHRQSVRDYEDLKQMYATAKKRFAIGTITKSDILQLELSMLNAKVDVTNNRQELDNRLFNLFSFLRLSEYQNAELVAPGDVPDVLIDTEQALQLALANTSHAPQQNLTRLQAQQAVAKAKSARGIQVQLKSEIGFNRTASTFSDAYTRLRDNEIIGLSLSLPVFDWGVSKGKVKMAEAQLELANTQIEQLRDEYVQDIRKQVLQFASRAEQCRTSKRAEDIAAERYEITKKRFEEGNISVTDLNTALQEAETAKSQYVNQLQTFWTDYYALRRATLYDWKLKRKLDADYDKLLNQKYDE